MQTTSNLGLKKPESDEYVDVSVLNYNADTLDEAVEGKVDLSGGNISETEITTLDTTTDEFPTSIVTGKQIGRAHV